MSKHAQHEAPEKREFDPARFTQNMSQLVREWQEMMSEFAKAGPSEERVANDKEMLLIGQAFGEMMTNLVTDPARMIDMQMDFFQRWVGVWENSVNRFLGAPAAETPELAARDRRFDDPAWNDSVWFDFIKQSYLASSKWLQDISRQMGDLDPHTAKKIDFYTRQFINAMAPSNFLMTNPEALKAMISTDGENLLRGFRHLRRDLIPSQGRLNIRMSDESAFALGRNLAMTPGKVVFRNDLMELIQYAPTTETVHTVPLLLIPAWINKFYIFDMQESNSYVRWLVDEGYTVFVVSWVNPDASLSEKDFESYMREGPLAALDTIEKVTGTKQTAIIGYCLGGTLLSITLAWLEAKGQANRVVSATYLTTMIDFSEPGELGVFIDDDQLAALEERMSAQGFLEGSEMSTTFNMLRSNDLIWSFVVNNYLLGKEPFPFDLLYWNADSTRMPARMHSFYLRNMYQQNKLRKKGGIKVGGVKIDLSTIKTPCYILSTREDHIAPWRSTFASTGIYSGPITFTLAASGHIAGVINPPSKQKYSYWTNGMSKGLGSEEWLRAAKEHAGSWWPHWEKWQAGHAGPMLPARQPKNARLGEAPGSYVKQR